MKFQFFLRCAMQLIGALVALAPAVPAFADEEVRLTLIHEQVLEKDTVQSEQWSLFSPCGSAGFLYVPRDEGVDRNWFLHSFSDDSATDTGLRYADEWPVGCSGDGRWATFLSLSSGNSRIVDLGGSSVQGSALLFNGAMSWSGLAPASILIWTFAGNDPVFEPAPDKLAGVDLFAGEVTPETFAAWPIWTEDGGVIVGLRGEEKVEIVEVPSESFRIDPAALPDAFQEFQSVLNTAGKSLLQSVEWTGEGWVFLETVGGTVLIHDYWYPHIVNHFLCTKTERWDCESVSVRPVADVAGSVMPSPILLNPVGHLFWIEDRAGEFCAAVGSAEAKHGRCVHDGPLSMFEEINWFGASPDRQYLYVTGLKADEDEEIVAIFELVLVPSD